MAEAIFNEGLRAVVAGVNPIHLKQGIEKAVEDITAKLKKMSTPVKSKVETAQVGTIAANNDAEIGELLAEAMDRVGKDGVITVDEGKSLQTEVEWVGGHAVRPRLSFPLFRLPIPKAWKRFSTTPTS